MDSKEPTTKKKKSVGINPEEMSQAGLHFGHRISRINPKMKPYIYGTRNTVHIIDLEKTAEKLQEALDFIKQEISNGKILVFIGTKIQFKNLTKKTAEDCNLPYINERWLGGTFTNFETIKKRIDYFKSLKEKKSKGEWQKYTKKERLEKERELKLLEEKFGGIEKLERIPDIIFVLDMKKDALAVREAGKKGVKVVGIADTNIDPTLADYPIPANDDAVSSVKYILEKIKDAILKGKEKAKAKKKIEDKEDKKEE